MSPAARTRHGHRQARGEATREPAARPPGRKDAMGLEAHPRRRIDKLGVKPGQRVSVSGIEDPDFERELAERTADVRHGRLAKGSDMIFLGARNIRDLARLPAAVRALERNGAVWVVWPKGRRELTEDHVRAAAFEANLVDVKVVAFSETLSALKLVIPLAKR